jgi:hypothetical protein
MTEMLAHGAPRLKADLRLQHEISFQNVTDADRPQGARLIRLA